MTSSTPTLRDVAAEAGVSPMTASNALRGKPGVKESTRAKVIAAACREMLENPALLDKIKQEFKDRKEAMSHTR